MNTMTESPALAVVGKQKMTPSEAFVETLVAQGVKDVFGIVGSAFMDALDLFPLAGIRFISVAHEQGAGHMADGYARVSGSARRLHRAERTGGHQFCHFHGRRLLGALAGGRGHAGDRIDGDRSRRIPGNRAAADLFQDHPLPGARQQPGAHGRTDRARVRPRATRNGTDAAQHPARFLLRRHRVRDSASARHRARRGRRAGAGRRGRRCSPSHASR